MTAEYHPSETLRKIDLSVQIALEHLSFGADCIALGDTTGMANPKLIQLVILKMQEANIPLDKIALHLHDTRGTALANALAGYQSGIRTFDGSTAGLGGCPYAPGATGNAASEDLLNMFNTMGIDTEVDFSKACSAGLTLRNILNKPLPGRYHNYHYAQHSTKVHSKESAIPTKMASNS